MVELRCAMCLEAPFGGDETTVFSPVFVLWMEKRFLYRCGIQSAVTVTFLNRSRK